MMTEAEAAAQGKLYAAIDLAWCKYGAATLEPERARQTAIAQAWRTYYEETRTDLRPVQD